MDNDTQQLLFAKQLMDNVEFANETGLRNLLQILETGSDQVVNGTTYAPGAFAAWKELIAARPELFTDELMKLLDERAGIGGGYGQQAAAYAVKCLKR